MVDKSKGISFVGHQLVDGIKVSDESLNFLFGALLLTSFGVFVAGNILLWDFVIFARSAQIALPCFILLLIFYSLSRQLCPIWGLVLTYLMIWAGVYSSLPGLRYVFYVLGFFAVLYSARFLRVAQKDWLSLALMAMIGTATILGVERAYTSFDMLPRLYMGAVHQDTLFHASIAGMIKNYGVVSTGLHGLVEIAYHTFSHVLMAGVSVMSGLGVVEVYGVAPWVLFAPILIFSSTVFVAMLDRQEQMSMPLVWAVTALILSVAPYLLSNWAVWQSYFISESYMVSLGLFLLGMGLLFKRTLRLQDLLLVFLLTALMAKAKSSVGVIYMGLWFSRVLFISGGRRMFDLGVLMMSAVAVGWVTFDAAAWFVTYAEPLRIFGFIEKNGLLGGHLVMVMDGLLGDSALSVGMMSMAVVAIISFFILHFLPSWVVICRACWVDGVRNIFRNPLAVYSMAALFAGMIVVTSDYFGGATFYFSNVAFFVALPGVVMIIVACCQRLSLNNCALIAVTIVIIGIIHYPAYYGKSIFDRQRNGLRGASTIHLQETSDTLIDRLLIIRQTSPKDVALRANDDILRDNPMRSCTAQPFLFPAVSERPWVGVIQRGGSCQYRAYGYDSYGVTIDDPEVKVLPQLHPSMQIQDVW